MNLISIVTPCHNEEGNTETIYRQVKAVFDQLKEKERINFEDSKKIME